MNTFFAKSVAALSLVATLALGAPAHAHGDDYDDLAAAFSTLGMTAITFFPTILTAEGSYVAADQTCQRDSSTQHDCDDVPYKVAYVRATALEAAQYLAGAAIGPNLAGFIKANPQYTPDQLIDGVLEVAEQL